MSFSTDNSIFVLLADTTHMSTQLLVESLRQDNRFEVAGASVGSEEFFAACIDSGPQVAVIGIRPNGSARSDFELVRRSLALHQQLRVIVLLDSSEDELVVESFRAGARGIVCRNDGIASLRQCIYAVHMGEIWATDDQLRYLLEVFSRGSVPDNGSALLSKRELDVARCVAQGMTNRDIGVRLSLSEHTVKNYLFRTFDKLGISNRRELILYAVNQAWTTKSSNPQ
jgi:two-component system, NarL family, nitrate/nitrite response regulator NarL